MKEITDPRAITLDEASRQARGSLCPKCGADGAYGGASLRRDRVQARSDNRHTSRTHAHACLASPSCTGGLGKHRVPHRAYPSAKDDVPPEYERDPRTDPWAGFAACPHDEVAGTTIAGVA